MRISKQYFKCYKVMSDTLEISYYHTADSSKLISMFDYVLPLGNRKPKSISREEIKEA